MRGVVSIIIGLVLIVGGLSREARAHRDPQRGRTGGGGRSGCRHRRGEDHQGQVRRLMSAERVFIPFQGNTRG